MMTRQVSTAINTTLQLSPGEPWPAEGQQPGAVNQLTSVTRISSTPTQTSTSTSTPSPIVHGTKLSTGAIAGISLAATAVVLLSAALCYFVGRSRTYDSMIKYQQESEATSTQENKSPTTTWSPLTLSPVLPGIYPTRFSNRTLSPSPQPQPGTFVGYNRETGAPEFTTDTRDEKAVLDHMAHPAFGRNSRQSTTYELPGEAPIVAEVGPYK
jgi:hypothetical protein